MRLIRSFTESYEEEGEQDTRQTVDEEWTSGKPNERMIYYFVEIQCNKSHSL
jgi:hypothetical protein